MILNADRKEFVSAADAAENMAVRAATDNRPSIVRSICGKASRSEIETDPCKDAEAPDLAEVPAVECAASPTADQAWDQDRKVSNLHRKIKSRLQTKMNLANDIPHVTIDTLSEFAANWLTCTNPDAPCSYNAF